MTRTRSRPLRPDEVAAFDDLRNWLDYLKQEMDEGHRRRLRVFFQDHPTDELRVDEGYEAF